ncbi:hypothetical protein [Lichenifustis flavocetrariae]|uniref:Uncharacterized protein n=1 Tax=Lichenifustis flavocetrariae TaxID=2949735 RepID=A0AA42CL73_9HYPH|nr:hypothetical protein [Lichenifustis flavocetrariae]MCW6507082.1 hypothetical protein [Lichenifustis flavocetrariae]
MDMEAIFKGMAEQAAKEAKRAKPLPEAVVMELREAAKRYARVNPFKVGDLVTPTTGANIKGQGDPHVVIGLRQPTYAFDGNPGSHTYGLRIDMRVLQIIDGLTVPFWVESAMFDAWNDPDAPAGHELITLPEMESARG